MPAGWTFLSSTVLPLAGLTETFSAAGRNTRTVTEPFLPGWAPSTACGWW